MVGLAIVALPQAENPVVVLAPALAAVGGVCHIQSGVCAGVPATGGPGLAGCFVLDDPAACDRREAGPQCDQDVFALCVYGRICVSDLGGGAGGGDDLQ